MTAESSAIFGKVIRSFGEVDSRIWRSVEDDVFVEESAGDSWAEVFALDLLQPRVSVNTVKDDRHTSGLIDPAIAITYRNDGSSRTTDYDNDAPGQMLTLRTAADITEYMRSTTSFRAFFIRQAHSWSPLLITSDLLCGILSQTRLQSTLKSFILYFGAREREVEIAPPALRFTWLPESNQGLTRSHECTYGLRFMERHDRTNLGPAFKAWSLRQCAIACRHTPDQSGTSWAFITLSKLMQRRLNSMALGGRFRQDVDPFEMHQLLIDAAISSWRPYLIELGAEIDGQYAQILGTSPTDTGPVNLHASGRRQDLMILDDKLLTAILALAATVDTSSALSASWESSLPVTQCQDLDYIRLMRGSFEHHRRSLGILSALVTQLRAKLTGATNLLSSFLDLSSGYSLQNLAQESSKENEEMRRLTDRMHKLAEKSTQDAAAVKVLTILTLIYLPITVVSNFFSTSFVNSTTTAKGSGSISVTSDWWILFAASVPLTLLTLYVWLVWTRIQANTHKQAWWKYVLGVRWLSDGIMASTLDESSCDRKVCKEAANANSGHVFRRTSSGLC